MNSLPLVVLVICVATINSQVVIYNHTVINTTVVQQNHGYVPVHIPQQPQRPQPPLRVVPGIPPPRVVPGVPVPVAAVPPAYGFRPNVIGYDPYAGHVNRTIGGRHKNDLIVGSPGPNDVILFKQWFKKGSRFLQTREKIITYPANPWTNRYQHTITAVACFDVSNSPGGHAMILSGGPGHRNVTIRLFSDRGEGFHYEVIIHGR